ncbi:hypothetical protein CONCODRAFT_4270 [Conidiobolus coronatus NRRL 28638]|uniref:G-protein coupled receptors family 1 profile domain-containing protein n=1 Tax=Conidiobolus coronatus (strain ATCC 28846 / CBS 209.66 / NRRL 28638) TaxID=796925 RepID=A0A137PD00_CONC2|nr:hypothetical protein CONCODRAFT_4270 [Conidiobolus coronatus NRRL 28638]|eukprot:KXN72876.1 hypothetical protein CONCODRAFT_4270 [Conidiobolus coronatus NRRL 28638]
MSAEPIKIDNNNKGYKDGLVIQSLIFGILGIILSSFILLQLAKKKKPRHIDTILSATAVIISLLGSIFIIIRGVLIKWPYNIFAYYPETCIGEYMLASQFNLIIVYPISLLSLERLLLIIFNLKFKGFYWLLILALFLLLHFTLTCIICYQRSFVLSISAFGCNTNPHSYWNFLTKYFMFAFILGFIIVTVSYISIIIVQYKRSIKSQLELNLNKVTVMRENKIILVKASIIILCFIISYSGKISCWMYQWITGNRRPWTLDYLANMLHLMHNFINCLIVIYMDPTLMETVIAKFNKLVPRA